MKRVGDYLLIYVIVEVSTALLYCWCLRMLQNKRGRSAQDGLLVMASWPKLNRHAVSFSVVLFSIVPTCVYVITNIGAALLSLSEGWSFIDSFEYVLCNAIGVGPLNALTTATVGGQLADVLISVVCLIFFSTVLGLCGSMGLIEDVSDMFGARKRGAFLAVLVILILHVILICVCASVLAVIEGYDLWACILYMAGLLCGIENPLTPFVPSSVEANFFASICAVLEYAVGGAIIGILAMNREMLGFIIKVEGRSTRTRQQMKEIAEDKLHEEAPAPTFQSQQSEDMQSKDNDPIVVVCAKDNLSNVAPRSDDYMGADSSASHTLKEPKNSQVPDLQGELAQAQEENSSARAEIQRLQRQLQEKDAVINAKLMQAEEADCGDGAEVNRLREQSQENASYELTAPDNSRVQDLQRDLKLAQEDNNSAHAEIQRLWGQLQEKDALGAEAARLREELQENDAKTKLARDKHDQIVQQMHKMREELLAWEQAANSKEEDKARSITREETQFSQLPSIPSWNPAEGREKRRCCS